MDNHFLQNIREDYEIRERDYLFWGAFMLEGLELLSKLDLTSLQLKILLFLCSKIEQKDNITYVKQTEIQEEIPQGFNKSNISKAIKNLRVKNLIAKVQNGYMINPNLFYLGKKDNQQLRLLHESFEKKMTNDSIYKGLNSNELQDLKDEGLLFKRPKT